MSFKSGLEDATEGAEVTRSGRLFQTRAAATGKLGHRLGSRLRLTINDDDELQVEVSGQIEMCLTRQQCAKHGGKITDSDWLIGLKQTN